MLLRNALLLSGIAILLFLSVNTVPLESDRNEQMDDFVVSSGSLQLKRSSRDTQHSAKFKNHNFGNWTKFKWNNESKFKWNDTKFKWDKCDNNSLFKKLDEMMESIERDLEELLNDTLSYADFLHSGEMFSDVDESFSFSSSESLSSSESSSETAGEEELGI